jgi:hypothetical protein
MRRTGLLVLLGFLIVAEASAGPSGEEEARVRAQQHFQNGVELYQNGNYAAALIEFESAYEAFPAPEVLYNMGQTATEAHEYALALEYFGRYLEDHAVDDTRRDEVLAEIQRLGGLVASVEVGSTTPGGQVFVDDRLVGTTPLETPVVVNVGPQSLRVEWPSGEVTQRTLHLAAGDHEVLTLEPSPTVAEPGSPGADGAEEEGSDTEVSGGEGRPAPRRGRPALWIGLATTAGATGAAIVTGVLALKAERDFHEEVDRRPTDERELGDARERGRRLATTTDILAASAAGAAVLTIAIGARKPAPRASVELGPGRVVWTRTF